MSLLKRFFCHLSALGFIALGLGLQAADWPQYLGPRRDAVYPGQALTLAWPSGGPKVLWRKRDIGAGMSGLVAAKGRVVLFHEVNRYDTIECLDAKTGKSLWKNNYASSFVPGYGSGAGPRATPAIVGGKVYTMGGQGIVVCTDLATGKTLWKVDAQKSYRASDGFFGMACSPLVEGNAVLLNIGGEAGAGIIALDKNNGKLLWKTLDDEASYSSPVMATLHGKRRAVFFTRTGMAVVNPANGSIDFQNRWRARIHASVNAAAPLVVGERIFITSSYNTGALVVQAATDGYKTVWSNDTSLSSQYASVMHRDGFPVRHPRARGCAANTGAALCRVGHRQSALERGRLWRLPDAALRRPAAGADGERRTGAWPSEPGRVEGDQPRPGCWLRCAQPTGPGERSALCPRPKPTRLPRRAVNQALGQAGGWT